MVTEDTKSKIIEYLKSKSGKYIAAEIAIGCSIRVDKAYEAISDLEREGRVNSITVFGSRKYYL